MRHVYMRASMDIWRTRSMNKEGDSPDCECYGRLRSNRLSRSVMSAAADISFFAIFIRQSVKKRTTAIFQTY